jgi:hypothetical protein
VTFRARAMIKPPAMAQCSTVQYGTASGKF